LNEPVLQTYESLCSASYFFNTRKITKLNTRLQGSNGLDNSVQITKGSGRLIHVENDGIIFTLTFDFSSNYPMIRTHTLKGKKWTIVRLMNDPT